MKVIVVMVVLFLVMGYSPQVSTEPFKVDFLGYFFKMKRSQ